ncbi:CHAT domain-containing protein, partial [Bacteroidota bacterium]
AQEKYREQALKDLTRSLEILQNCYGEHHTEVSKQHLQIARFYQEVITLYYEFVAHFNQNMISAEKVIDEYQIEDQNDQENYDALIVRYNNLLSYFKSSYRDLLIFDELRLKHYQNAFLAVISDTSKKDVIVSNVLRHIKTMDISQYINSPETFRNILYTKCHYNKPMYKDLSIDVMYDVFTWAAVDNEDVTTYGNERRDALTGINNEYLHLDKLEKNMGSISDYDQLIDIMIQGYINEDDQFALAHRTKYHRLIAVDQILGNRRRYTARTSETRIDQLDEAFYYIEKTKALVLMSSMSESEAIINTQIPAELVQQEQELQHKIRISNRDIVITNSQESKNELRRLKSELRDLKNQLAKTYPRYNKSRYSLDIAGLSEIKETLDDKTALISYSTSPDNMIIFIITSSKIEYKVINLTDDEIIKQVKAFRNSILYRSDEALVVSGKELFDKLIPKLNKEIDKLIIIPDGELATIPFEALLSEKVPKRELGTYVNYPFMILNYQISYAFSGTLYLQNQKGEQYSESNKFLGFAPVFSDGSEEGIVRNSTLDAMQSSGELDENRTRGVLRNGKYINPIPSTETEVNNLYDLFDQKGFSAKVFTHDRASESTLKTEDLNQYKFIHFATHGMVNEKHPELSGLLFAQTTDQDDDGMLYSGEIYNLDINADLVSLSACETGLGKVVTGEGVVGLSRAFTYAGTKNLLVSYWKVSDESTSILMQDFYRNALDSETKMTYGAALRTAKLNMINKGTYIHPYYWSPFVIIGN